MMFPGAYIHDSQWDIYNSPLFQQNIQCKTPSAVGTLGIIHKNICVNTQTYIAHAYIHKSVFIYFSVYVYVFLFRL